MSIAVLTPSRGRPDRFREMVEAIRATVSDPMEVDIYLATDDDDPSEYTQLPGVVWTRGPRQRLAGATNALAEIAMEDGHEILAFLGDDHRPRTQNWDQMVTEAFWHMGSGLVYCADGLQNERLPTAPFWTADVIRGLGWYYPPVLTHMYADNYWLQLAHDLGRCTYLGNVLIEHMHPDAGKADADDTYRENNTHYDHDKAAFEEFLRHGHGDALRSVQEAICGR